MKKTIAKIISIAILDLVIGALIVYAIISKNEVFLAIAAGIFLLAIPYVFYTAKGISKLIVSRIRPSSTVEDDEYEEDYDDYEKEEDYNTDYYCSNDDEVSVYEDEGSTIFMDELGKEFGRR